MICFPMNLRIRVKTQRIHKQIQSFFVNFRCEFCERSRLTASDPYRHGLIQRSQVVQTHFCYFLLAISMDFFFPKKISYRWFILFEYIYIFKILKRFFLLQAPIYFLVSIDSQFHKRILPGNMVFSEKTLGKSWFLLGFQVQVFSISVGSSCEF